MNKTPIKINESRVEHEGLEKSATLKRSYVNRPEKLIEEEPATETENVVEISSKITHFEISEPEEAVEVSDSAAVEVEEAAIDVEMPAEEPKEDPRDEKQIDEKPEKHPVQARAEKRMTRASAQKAQTRKPISQLSAREMKDAAIEKALRDVHEEQEATLARTMNRERRRKSRNKFIAAFAASVACIGVLGYFISLRMPDISFRVAAMQTGIDAVYPSYVPRDYRLAGVSGGKSEGVVMNFVGPNNYSFTLTEEKSSWDSAALLSNYVKKNWNDDYDVIREGGLTIYVSHSDAAWLNAGKLFVIDASSNNLTKKQIKNIAISL